MKVTIEATKVPCKKSSNYYRILLCQSGDITTTAKDYSEAEARASAAALKDVQNVVAILKFEA